MGDNVPHTLIIEPKYEQEIPKEVAERQKRVYEELLRADNLLDRETNPTKTPQSGEKSEAVPRDSM